MVLIEKDSEATRGCFRISRKNSNNKDNVNAKTYKAHQEHNYLNKKEDIHNTRKNKDTKTLFSDNTQKV
jgi:hypothetical protein